MTKFCFQRRITCISDVWFEADTEAEAWSRALDGQGAEVTSDERITNKPIFRRLPNLDEHDL